jgi:hypothetical protein
MQARSEDEAVLRSEAVRMGGDIMQTYSFRRRIALVSFILTAVAGWALWGQGPGDPLLRGFLNPPDSAKPRVWWHWMSGNITKEGIRADLEWMKRIGIGGFQNFDAGLNTPQIVEKRLVFMTPEWKEAFRYATELADKLGLEMAIAGSPGWSESGGPWVPPAQGMKKYVWSETIVEGGRPFTGVLPKPPSATGPYQNQAGGGRGFGMGQAPAPLPEHYADAAVVAFPAPEGGRRFSELQPKVSASGGTFTVAALTDGDAAQAALLPAAPVGERSWIQYEFAQPQTFRGMTFLTAGGGGMGFGPRAATSNQQLEASGDGRAFRLVAPIPPGARTIAFEPVTARYFRVSILTPEPPRNPGGFGGFGGGQARGPQAPAGAQIAEFVLHSAVVNRFQEKAAFTAAANIYGMATPPVPAELAVPKASVTDLTGRMRPDGRLDWTPPPGRWTVLRIGYSLTGQRNHPASPEATGLEVDKLNPAFIKAYFDNYLDQYKEATGGLMGKRGLQYVITDSWEANTQNWTDHMIAEFNTRRGYDIRPWLPALAGHIVESAEATDRVFWDFRRTLADMVAEYHYDQLTEILKARGMGRYTESHEVGRAFIGDGMEVKRSAAVPMSAMWTPQGNRGSERYDADIRESASVAHIYGQNIVAAESLTAGSGAWGWSPETLKPTADRELSQGLNRFVIHTSVHQPVNDKIPGLGLGPFGQWFTRHETWAEQAKAWTGYLARSSYMLQQGRFVADVVYYYGEDTNVTALFGDGPPPVPEGYNFDYINSDALRTRLAAGPGGTLMTPSGMRYRLLALDPNSRLMPLSVLRKIRDLAEAGAAVAGPKPAASPSLADDQAEFKAIADRLWGGHPGKGRVFGSGTIGEALAALGVQPDFAYSKPQADTELAFVHRQLADGEIYWVSNRKGRAERVEAVFRVAGKAPELWHAETGSVEPASYRIADGRTTVPLELGPHDAVFAVFRKAAGAPSRTVPKPAETVLAAVEGAWEIAFQPNRGAPPKLTLAELGSWHEHPDPGVKYFSGTAVYTKTVEAPAAWFKPGAKLWLDLGAVKNIAEVAVNGKALGILWKPPFRVDVTPAMKPGANRLEIKVTNLWVNRLIGDQQPGAAAKYTYTAQPFYRADSPLLPSGLTGPVQLTRSEFK